eukprot:g6450.t1
MPSYKKKKKKIMTMPAPSSKKKIVMPVPFTSGKKKVVVPRARIESGSVYSRQCADIDVIDFLSRQEILREDEAFATNLFRSQREQNVSDLREFTIGVREQRLKRRADIRPRIVGGWQDAKVGKRMERRALLRQKLAVERQSRKDQGEEKTKARYSSRGNQREEKTKARWSTPQSSSKPQVLANAYTVETKEKERMDVNSLEGMLSLLSKQHEAEIEEQNRIVTLFKKAGIQPPQRRVLQRALSTSFAVEPPPVPKKRVVPGCGFWLPSNPNASSVKARAKSGGKKKRSKKKGGGKKKSSGGKRKAKKKK